MALLLPATTLIAAGLITRAYREDPHSRFTEGRRQWLRGGPKNRKPKMTYTARDFLYYQLMCIMVILVTNWSYGREHAFARLVGYGVAFLDIMFILRHGVEMRFDMIGSSIVVESLSLVKSMVENVRPGWFLQVGALFFEAWLVEQCSSLAMEWGLQDLAFIGATREFTALITFGLTDGLFYLSFTLTTLFRVASFTHHVYNSDKVFSFLSETGWRKSLGLFAKHGKHAETAGRFLLLTHALITGIITHIITVAPWFVVNQFYKAQMLQTEAILSPLFYFLSFTFRTLVLDPYLMTDMESNDLNEWYVKDHWETHHSTLAFTLLHGPHHDALPISIIAVADNGPLEGFTRHAFFGHFDSFAAPVRAFYTFTRIIVRDMVGHQYVPGVFPYSFSVVDVGAHHVEHHFLQLYPVGNGIEGDDDPRNNCAMEAWLSGGPAPGEKKVEQNDVQNTTHYSAENKLWKWFCSEVFEREATWVEWLGSTNLKSKMVAKGAKEVGKQVPMSMTVG